MMKALRALPITVMVLFFFCQLGSADRLHQWTDSKGVIHLSKDPPPADAKSVQIMEYSVSSDKPSVPERTQPPRNPASQNGNVTVEKMQETGMRRKPQVDLATTCYLYADREAVYVYVIEFKNPDRAIEYVLYEGLIPEGQKQVIRSSRGKIEFNYRFSSDDRGYGDNHADCVNGKVIRVQ